jgi:predicted permease
MTSTSPRPDRSQGALIAYLEANRGKFTDEALTEALMKEGYSKEAVVAGFAAIAAADASKPVRARARNLVLAAYGITYAVLVLGMLTTSANYGAGGIGTAVLTLTLGLALAISLWVVRRSKGKVDGGAMVMAGMLAVPVILLVIVAGLCVATGLPFHPTTI